MNLENTLNNIISKSASAVEINDVDYIKDGLLFCGKCNTPKQTEISFLGKIEKPFCLCKCEIEKAEEQENVRKQQESADLIKRLRYNAFPDCKVSNGKEDMKNWTFENDNGSHPQIMAAAEKYSENFELFKVKGKGLLLYGTVGTGKSYIAAAIANRLIDKNIPVLFTNFARIANEMQETYDKQEYIDGFNRYELLIIDDLAAERKTDYMQEIVWNVINSRSLAGLPMLITSNLTAEELKNPANISCQRNYSRLVKCCHPIKVEGTDQRKSKAVQDYAEMQKLLGL